MSQTAYIKWEELLRQSALREGDLDILEEVEQETDTPFFGKSDLEALHYEIACRTLLTMPMERLEQIGSVAISAVSAIDGYTLPRNTLRIVSVTTYQVDGTPTVPMIYVSPAEWYQSLTADDETLKRWTVMDGKVYFRGGIAIDIVTVYAPTLEMFRADHPILPPGTEEDRLDWVHHMLQTIDFLPQGRA
jgi:hypothetical protein